MLCAGFVLCYTHFYTLFFALIALAEFLPRLFLQDFYKELNDLVVLDLKWLLTAMKVIMEITVRDDVADLTLSQKRRLEKNGVADFEVFEVCWKKFVSEPIKVRHLCLIFQAYCLMFPVANQQQFIIPSKLPDNIHIGQVCKVLEEYTTFYFDFNQFLPDEIYHRLICLASSYCKVERSQRLSNCYSKRICFFSRLRDTNWVIEMEEENQTLKFMVL